MRSVHCLNDILFVSDVSAHVAHCGTKVLHQCVCALIVKICDHNVCALIDKAANGCLAKATSTTGDDCGSALDFHASSWCAFESNSCVNYGGVVHQM